MAQQTAAEPASDEVDDLIDELQPGAKLLKGQYTITRYINSGGFGITYLAKDSLDRDVVIKECFPSSVCRRSKVMVAARSRAHTAELRAIVQLFVREARSLAKIVHPNIVSVHQVFEDNGTAYMALDYIDGLDLQQIIDGEGKRPTPAEIVVLTEKLLKAVGFIHQNDMLHRDISPDNVLIDKKGEPILIDFGAAREKASQTNRAMSALRVVKDGYSPQEFYIAGSEQGPWSDLYALGATLYHLISGEAPVNGQARLGALAEDRPDPYTPLAGRFPGYPAGFLEAIDRALCTLPKQRLQTADAWLAMFSRQPAAAEPEPGTEDAVHRLVNDFQREEAQVAAQPVAPARPVSQPQPAASAAPAAVAPARKSPLPMLAGGVLVVALAGGVYAFLGGGPQAPGAAREAGAATGTAAVVQGSTAGTPTRGTAPDTATATASEPATETAVAPAVETAAATVSAPGLTTSAAPAIEPAPAPESSTVAEAAQVASDPAPAAETAAATAEPAAEAAPEAAVGTATAEAIATEPAVTETAAAAPEPAAEPAAAPAVEVKGTPAANQIAFAAWDAELPFTADDRIMGGKPTPVVLRVSPDANLAEVGNWLQRGLLIYGVNGTPTPTGTALTAAILNAMQVDPDGKARLVVEYAGSDLKRQTGLLTVGAVRLVGLVNGVSVRTAVIDGAWTTTVTGVTRPQLTTLRQGDILFRDKTTGIPLSTPDALETILRDLVARGAMQTEFSIIRNGKVDAATLQLAAAEAP
ncbi:serine/threonine-protein kinase [Rhodobacter calidifons]|uniref:non-specific serine/threonine protein kinase n=1 Tax=Rhodobacter calidifons TaxID=2715277 RepID=A0ABX0GAQ1_9RHOB|nr:serine/threonine-protein kinase [Rhodobacter calidifons]NHB77922.1 serine/threonine protein kinase [Rhodobacter calidifons]